MENVYRSPYEAYPFLSESSEDLRCDFEIATDHAASLTGFLRSLVPDDSIREELLRIGELIYHCNPALRTHFTVTKNETDWLLSRVQCLEQENTGRCQRFVLPQGGPSGSIAHILRAESKSLVRLLYRYGSAGNPVDEGLCDFLNLLSGYFFQLAMRLNSLDGIDEIPYISRNY